MPTFKTLQKLALSFPEVVEEPHFDKTSFRINNKIFATYNQKNNKVTVKLSEIDQDVFVSMSKKAMYPVDNKWGKQGWTFIELDDVHDELFVDAVTTAYCEVAPQRFSELVRPNKKE